jgi:F-type H+-transporting ATPase subunit epsilon
MMAERLHLEVVTRLRKVVEDEVDEVRLPGVLGELGVLPGHTPLLTALAIGRLAYTAGGQEHRMVVEQGFAEIQPDRVTVLAREATLPGEVDRDAEQAKYDEASEQLKNAGVTDLEEITSRQRSAEANLQLLG